MGELRQTIDFHYSKGRIETLIDYANNITVDKDDRELARELAMKLREERAAQIKAKEMEEK